MGKNLLYIRIIIVAFLLCLCPARATAQRVSPEVMGHDQLELYRHKAMKMRNAGMVLTLGGLGVVTTGIILGNIPDRIEDDDTGGDHSHSGISIWTVAFIDMTGGIITTAGIPLWAVGGSRKARAEVALKKFSTTNEKPIAVGLGITIRF
jgi:hypothetical protein